jgi:hypothetical protein
LASRNTWLCNRHGARRPGRRQIGVDATVHSEYFCESRYGIPTSQYRSSPAAGAHFPHPRLGQFLKGRLYAANRSAYPNVRVKSQPCRLLKRAFLYFLYKVGSIGNTGLAIDPLIERVVCLRNLFVCHNTSEAELRSALFADKSHIKAWRRLPTASWSDLHIFCVLTCTYDAHTSVLNALWIAILEQ